MENGSFKGCGGGISAADLLVVEGEFGGLFWVSSVVVFWRVLWLSSSILGSVRKKKVEVIWLVIWCEVSRRGSTGF